MHKKGQSIWKAAAIYHSIEKSTAFWKKAVKCAFRDLCFAIKIIS